MHRNLHRELDNDFKQIGEFGAYQFSIFVLVGLTSCIPAILAYSYIFIGATPDYRCKLENYMNDSYEIQGDDHKYLIDKYIPFENNSLNEFDKCKLNQFINGTLLNSTYKCDSWVFSNKYYSKTIVNDWKLICGNDTKKSTFSTVYFAGLYGVLLIGILSDKLGRKKSAYIFMISNAVFSLLIAILTNLKSINDETKQILFGILRFLTGVSSNVYSVAIVLAIEITGPRYRITASNCIYYFYILGEYITVLICYFIRDYDHIYICIAVIMLIFPCYFWVVPESPRWLLMKGKYSDAFKVLKRIASSNKKVVPERYELLSLNDQNNKQIPESTEINEDENQQQPGFLETLKCLIKSKKLFIRTLVVIFNWLTNNFVYYGISMGSNQLAGDPYLNFTLLATNELFAIICTHFAFDKFGRRIPYVLNMGLAGLALLGVVFVPKTYPLIITIMALIGKFAISFTYNGIYIITSELYPTVIRNTSVSIAQAFARLGAVIAPSINLLGELYWRPIPFIIYGCFATLSTILTLLVIPETKNMKLPDTLNDIK